MLPLFLKRDPGIKLPEMADEKGVVSVKDAQHDNDQIAEQPSTSQNKNSSSKSKSSSTFVLVMNFAVMFWIIFHVRNQQQDLAESWGFSSLENATSAAKCPAQPRALSSGADWNPIADPDYTSLATGRLSRAVQHRTESFDNFVYLAPNDPALDKHYAFADWLKQEYKAVFDKVEYQEVNYHGHLLTWKGKNANLKPILLMAHTDTVPVINETLSQWTHPPFEGTVAPGIGADGKEVDYIWGRGASDCKNSLLGIFGAVEKLILEGYEPERTVVIASGFDEEIGGAQGAGKLAKVLEKQYGHNSFALVFDEGFSGLQYHYGAVVASFGMAEKGFFNAQIKVETPGGHSSVPPPHSGIGIMSLILAHLEANPFQPSLDPSSPYLKLLNCLSEHTPKFPSKVAKDLKNPLVWQKLAKELADEDRIANSFLATTQAIDLIQGGVKVNALPEVVQATINHRIAFSSSVNETQTHIINLVEPLARNLSFSFDAFGHVYGNGTKTERHISLAQSGEYALEPAPISPADSKAYELMAGTVKGVFGKEVVTSPTGMYANTDTRVMWNLSKHIYRFTPALVEENKNVHTVDERISVAGHLNTTRYFYSLIRNTEGWKSD